jgi:hypothetical protein
MPPIVGVPFLARHRLVHLRLIELGEVAELVLGSHAITRAEHDAETKLVTTATVAWNVTNVKTRRTRARARRASLANFGRSGKSMVTTKHEEHEAQTGVGNRFVRFVASVVKSSQDAVLR